VPNNGNYQRSQVHDTARDRQPSASDGEISKGSVRENQGGDREGNNAITN